MNGPSRPLIFAGTDREREAARRELARMPDDLLAEVHAVAKRHSTTPLDAMTFVIHQAHCAKCSEVTP